MVFACRNLKELRELKNFSQPQLAEMVGTSQQMISYYEKGLREPNASTLINMAIALNSSIDDIVGLEQIRKEN